jgi:hypothetical protein
MEAMTVTISFRPFAVAEDVDDTPSPPLFAKRPGEVFDKIISTVARSSRWKKKTKSITPLK